MGDIYITANNLCSSLKLCGKGVIPVRAYELKVSRDEALSILTKMKLLKIGKKIYLKTVEDERCIGEIDRGGIFRTWRNKLHFFRKIQGFCFSRELIFSLDDMGIKTVVVIYKRTDGGREIYKTSIDKLLLEGEEVKEKGFERQLGLPLSEFERIL